MRAKVGAGVWEHRGKVAVAGIGHSPVDRRWETGNFDKSLGAYSILAARLALEDAGISLDQIDGIVSAPGPLGDNWAPRPFFAPPYDTEDGITKVTAEWLARGLGLQADRLKFMSNEPAYIGLEWGYAVEAVATGKANTLLMLYPSGNVEGRYHQQTDKLARGPMNPRVRATIGQPRLTGIQRVHVGSNPTDTIDVVDVVRGSTERRSR